MQIKIEDPIWLIWKLFSNIDNCPFVSLPWLFDPIKYENIGIKKKKWKSSKAKLSFIWVRISCRV